MRKRTNLIHHRAEAWRPPLFPPAASIQARIFGCLRRFLDLQAGSVWRDLCAELPRVRGRVLDVGCGAQPYRRLFCCEVEYRGIDTAEAKAHFGYEVPDTVYFSGSVWPVPDNSIDLILSTETLEHVTNPRQFLAEAYRCAAPGGRILLTVPFAARWHFIPHDYWRFTPSSLDMLLTEAGFADRVVLARGNRLTVACYKLMALILPLLMPQGHGVIVSCFMCLLSLPLLPILLILALTGNLSLRCNGGDDCLGYTVEAIKPARPLPLTNGEHAVSPGEIA